VLLGPLEPENGGDISLRNVGYLVMDCAAMNRRATVVETPNPVRDVSIT
jgi:hypothetical protein